MALKIPESPNIIGGDAVLRSARGVQGATETPKFQVDNKALMESTQAVGTLLSNVEKMREDTLMADAQSWWMMNMDNKENMVKDNFKGKNAMNLFTNQMKPYADKLEKDLFGDPKDDDVVRIANPALQQKFKEWANRQLVQYNARMGDYEGRELTKYNESTFDAREAQITNMLRQATTVPEIMGGADSYLELQSVRYRGMNPDYIKQLAFSKTDAAVTENVKDQIQVNVREGRNFFERNPEVRAVLSESSQKAINDKIKEEWVAQAITAGGEGIAAGDNGAALNSWTDASMLAEVFGTTDQNQLNAIQKKIYGGAKERADALSKKAEGVADMMRGQQAAQIANAQNDDEMLAAIQNISLSDSAWASAVDKGREKDLALAKRISDVKNADVSDLKDRSKLLDVQKKLEMPISFGFETVRMEDIMKARTTEIEPLTQQEQDVLEENSAIQEDLRNQTEVYADLLNDVVNGVYVGGYDPRLDQLGGTMQKAIYQAVASEQQYRNVANRYPEMGSMLDKVDSSFDNSAKARTKRIMAEIVNQADSNGANKLDAARLQQLANYAITQAKDPVSNALEDAITQTYDAPDFGADTDFLSSEERVNIQAERERDLSIRQAGYKAFASDTALKSTKTSDRTDTKQTKRAKKVISQFRKNLPEGTRSVVDDNQDLFINWYKLGNTSAILNFVRNWNTITQPTGE